MECKLQAGDKVVCVQELDAIEQILYKNRGPILDEVYHVRKLHKSDCVKCKGRHIYVALKEILVRDQGFGEPGFLHEMFRKLLTIEDFQSTDIDAPVDRIKEPELT